MALDNLPTLIRHCVQYLTGHLFSVIVIFMVSGVDDLEKNLVVAELPSLPSSDS